MSGRKAAPASGSSPAKGRKKVTPANQEATHTLEMVPPRANPLNPLEVLFDELLLAIHSQEQPIGVENAKGVNGHAHKKEPTEPSAAASVGQDGGIGEILHALRLMCCAPYYRRFIESATGYNRVLQWDSVENTGGNPPRGPSSVDAVSYIIGLLKRSEINNAKPACSSGDDIPVLQSVTSEKEFVLQAFQFVDLARYCHVKNQSVASTDEQQSVPPTAPPFFEFCQNALVGIPAFRDINDVLSGLELVFLMIDFADRLTLMLPSGISKPIDQLITAKRIRHSTVAMCVRGTLLLCVMVFAARLAKMQRLPRCIRLCANFQFSPSGAAVFSYVLAAHTGASISTTIPHCLTAGVIARTAFIGPAELQSFLYTERPHMKEGVIVVMDSSRLLRASIDARYVMSTEVVAALSGVDLPEEELVKLEGTCLWKILLAEKKGDFSDLIISTEAKVPSQPATKSKADAKAEIREKKKLRKELAKRLQGKIGDIMGSDGSSSDSSSSSDDDEDDAAEGAENGTDDDQKTNTEDTPRIAGQKRERCEGSENVMSPLVPPSALTVQPYTSDIEYCDDAFKSLAYRVKARNSEGDIKDDDESYFTAPKNKVEAQLREQVGKQRVYKAKMEARLEATRAAGSWIPRIERVAARLGLSDFEKQILFLLVGNVVSHDILIAINGRYVMRDGARELTVGYILFVLCESLNDRVTSRTCFYQSAALVKNGLISVTIGSTGRSRFNTDLMDYLVDIDRSIVDFLMGTDIDTDELVQGSKLYAPSIPIENVILPKETKEKVQSTIEHYSLFAKCKQRCGFGDKLGYGGQGLVFLFYGPSGTGKTMLANAVAHDLKKKILLVNLLQFKGDTKAPEMLRYCFREAKLNDAIVFFDECEGFFEQRDANQNVTSVLAEFERYDGMIILATNRAQVLDDAMNRRISLMIEFRLPDHQMRHSIWKNHLPSHLVLAEDVNLQVLALDYELSGGLIRNALLAAINSAVAREKTDTPQIKMSDLVAGAKQQLRGFFQASERSSDRYVTPARSFDELILEASTKEKVVNVAKILKSRNTLFSQWGFNELEYQDQGELVLFAGNSGTGKSLAAECIAYECGSSIRMCNLSELALMEGERGIASISSVFDEARQLGSIIVFDQAQVLFEHTNISTQAAQLVQYHAVRYPRPVIVIATTAPGALNAVDTRSSNMIFSAEVHFQLPGRSLRKELWRRCLPDKVPLADDVDFEVLSKDQLSAKAIRSICFSVCCKVALLPPTDHRVCLKHIEDERQAYQLRDQRRNTHSSMFT